MKDKEQQAREAVERILGAAPDMPEESAEEKSPVRAKRWRDKAFGALFAVTVVYASQYYLEIIDTNAQLMAENAALTKELLNVMFTDIPDSIPGLDDITESFTGV